MTTITISRAIVEQALEALKDDQYRLVEVSPNQYEYKTGLLVEVSPNQYEYKTDLAIAALERALAQQAEAWVCPESPEHRYTKPGHCEDCGKTLVLAQQAEPVEPVAWVLDGTSVVEFDRQTYHDGPEWTPLYTAPPQQAEPVDTDCHTQGICQRSGYGIGKQSDPQIEDRLARHGINPCPDCRGIGYDASGQLCWCQQNPSF